MLPRGSLPREVCFAKSASKLRARAEVALANLLWAAAVAGVPPKVLGASLIGATEKVLAQLQGAELARCLWALGPSLQ